MQNCEKKIYLAFEVVLPPSNKIDHDLLKHRSTQT